MSFRQRSLLPSYKDRGTTLVVKASLFDRLVAMLGGALAGPLMFAISAAFGMQSGYWLVLLSFLCIAGAIAGLFGQFLYLAVQRISRKDFIRRDRLTNLIDVAADDISQYYARQGNGLEANIIVREVRDKINELLNG